MVLSNDNYVNLVSVVDGIANRDFRKSNDLLNLLLSTAQSQSLTARAIAAGGPGGFAKRINFPVFTQAALAPTDGYSALSFPGGTDVDLSGASAYPILSDVEIQIDINKLALGTNRIPILDEWTHAAGSLLMDEAVASNVQSIKDQMESYVINNMLDVGQFQSVSAGLGVNWNLDTSSSDNLLDDLKLLAGQMNTLNVPREERKLLVPAAVEPVVIKYAALSNRNDFEVPNSATDARMIRYAGFDWVFSNNISSTRAVAFASSRFVVSMPKGIVSRVIPGISTLSDYLQVFTMFGSGPVGKMVAAADGNNPSHTFQREGVLRISVT